MPLAGEPSISPFFAPRAPSVEDSSSDTETACTPEEQEPSPKQEQQDNPILEAQLQYILDIQDRELENPSAPHFPAYQNLIEEAVEAGLNIPSPPPLATLERLPSPGLLTVPPIAPPAPQPPVPPPNPPAVIMAAPAPQTDKLIGKDQPHSPENVEPQKHGNKATRFSGT